MRKRLSLDGVNSGFVKAMAGGSIYAEVVNEPIGADKFVHKHIGQPKYEDYTLQIGFSMAKGVYDWVAGTWKGNYARKNGEIITTDANLKPTASKQFYNALLTEVTMPALDGSSKEPAYMTLKFAPEYTRNGKAPDAKSTTTAPRAEQKSFIPSNFRLEIDGLDATKVSKIDAFTVKQGAVQDSVGDARDQQREPGKLEFPNLKVTLSAASIDAWNGWLDDFVIKGNNDQGKEKNGTIYYLATDRQTVLAKVKLYNIGAGADQDRRITASAPARLLPWPAPAYARKWRQWQMRRVRRPVVYCERKPLAGEMIPCRPPCRCTGSAF